MKHLLNLLAAVALLVWGTHMVRTGVLRVFGANLRSLLARSMGNRFSAALSGIGVTALVSIEAGHGVERLRDRGVFRPVNLFADRKRALKQRRDVRRLFMRRDGEIAHRVAKLRER